MLTITVEESAFRAYLQALQERLGNLAPALDEIGDLLEERIRQRFETRTDPSGAPWLPWAESTRENYPTPGAKTAERLKYGPGHGNLLDRYGTMLRSLNHQTDAASVTIGFASDYAVCHEFGTRKMPRRGLVFQNPESGRLAPDDEQAVIDILQDWLMPE